MSAPLVRIRLFLRGGHSQDVELEASSPELERLHRLLSLRNAASVEDYKQLFQLPFNGGNGAFSFHAADLVAISTEPPVLVHFEGEPAAPRAEATAIAQVLRPQHLIIDDFLGPYEYRDMLAYALQHEDALDAGTVTQGVHAARQNLVLLDFARHPHSKLVCNRLLTWFPTILDILGIEPFPVHQVESQLTASNDGHFYRSHVDRDPDTQIERVLTCVYYFSKKPAPFAGGALRLYDTQTIDGGTTQAESFQQIEPVANRMVVFPSDSHHELMPIRCPGGSFEDSRFAITNWIWRSSAPDAQARHGWGHMRCGRVPEGWLPGSGDAR